MLRNLQGDMRGGRPLRQVPDSLRDSSRRHSDALALRRKPRRDFPSGPSRPKSFRNLIKFLAYHNEAYNQLLFYFVAQLWLSVGL